VCKTLKGNSTTEPIPIIIITQLNTKAEKINAIECGADDYVEKPFDIDELVARIKMVSRRAARTF